MVATDSASYEKKLANFVKFAVRIIRLNLCQTKPHTSFYFRFIITSLAFFYLKICYFEVLFNLKVKL